MIQHIAQMAKRRQAIGRALFGGHPCRSAPPRPIAPGRPARRRRGVRILLIPALFWVFTQLVMSGMALQPVRALAGGLHVITICTGTELTTITVDADGQPVKDVPVKKVTCPWCAQFGGIGELPPPDPTPVLLACGRAHKLALPKGQAIATAAPFAHYITRAPPFSTSF